MHSNGSVCCWSKCSKMGCCLSFTLALHHLTLRKAHTMFLFANNTKQLTFSLRVAKNQVYILKLLDGFTDRLLKASPSIQ